MAVALVGTMLVASTAVFGGIARGRAQQTESRLAYLLAQQLMSEILQTPFGTSTTTFGPSSGQTRAAFATVDAYDGYTSSPPKTQSGATLADYAGWSQAVSVAYADPANPAGAAAAAATPLKRVTVTVTAPSGKPYTLIGLRSKFGPYEQMPAQLTTYVTGVSVRLQGPTPGKAVNTGAHPLNVTTSQ